MPPPIRGFRVVRPWETEPPVIVATEYLDASYLADR
jgi:hypothetical protein